MILFSSMKNSPLALLLQVLKRKDLFLLQAASLTIVLISNGLSLVTPQLAAKIIDDYFAGNRVLVTWLPLVVFILTGTVIASFLQNFLSGVLSEKVAFVLREKLIEKYLAQQYSFILNLKTSKIMTVIGSDVNSLKQLISQLINGILTAVILLFGSIYLMFAINVRLTIVVLLIVPTSLLLVTTVIKKARELFTRAQGVRDAMNRIIDENIKAAMLIRVFVSETTETDKFKNANTETKTVGTQIVKIFSLVLPILQSTNLLGTLLVLLIGGQAVMTGEMSLGDLSAFNNYVIMFTMPILMLSFIFSSLGQAFASLGRINELLSAESGFIDGTEELKAFEELQAKGVSFEVDGNRIINEIDFKIKKGEHVGIVGLNGSGKTMLLNLLTRQLDATSGEILINDKAIASYRLSDIRKLLGFAFQENFVLDASIYQNIDFGRALPADAVLRAAEIAEVTEFSTKFEDGLQHQVGERGTTLSGGQKQRIMIARSLAEEPELLLLDDVTSMLDVVTEQRILKNIREQYPNIAIIIISQKIVSLKECDRIYVLEQGKNEATGNHEQLLKKSTLYEEIELTQRNYRH